jgi:hypothetical protein
MLKKVIAVLLILVVLSIFSTITYNYYGYVSGSLDIIHDHSYMFKQLPIGLNLESFSPNTSNITLPGNFIRYIKIFSNISDRLTGHKGYFEATRIITSILSNITRGNIFLDNYTIVVPVDTGSFMSINGLKIKVYPMWPSGGVPVNTHCSGRIIVAKSIEGLNGRDLRNSIVLIPMSTDWHWQWLLDPSLGVRAVIFYEDNMSNSEMYNKYLDIPVRLPLGYLSLKELKMRYGLSLSSLDGKYAVLKLSSRWVEENVSNIIAYIPGKNHGYKIVLLAHYDSWSPVVGDAPGATDILAPAYLLTYAEKLVNETPQYDTLIVLFSGYYESLEGERHFVEKYVFNRAKLVFGNTTIMLDPAKTLFIGIDLNYRSRYIAPSSIGYFYYAQAVGITRGPINIYAGFITHVFDEAKLYNEISEKLGTSLALVEKQLFLYSRDPRIWWTLFPGPYWLDTEPFWSSGLAAFTLKSAFAEKGVRGTPIDYYEYINYANMAIQYNLLNIILDNIYSRTPKQLGLAIRMGLSPNAPVRTNVSPRDEMFADLIGQVMVWNPRIGQEITLREANLSRALVIISAGSRQRATVPWNLRIVRLTDRDGYFFVEGLPTHLSTSLTITALILSDNGSVIAVNVMGSVSRGSSVALSQPILGSRMAPWEVWIIKLYGNISINMVIDPLTYQTPYEGGSIGYKIVRVKDMAQPSYYYAAIDENGYFVTYLYKTNMNYSIVFGPSPVYYVFENVRTGHSYSLYYALKSTINIVDRRLGRLAEYKVRSPAAEEFLIRGKRALGNATLMLQNHNYTAYRAYVLEGITLSYNAYQLMKSAYLDVENSATLFSILLVLFAFIAALYFRKPGVSPFITIGKTTAVTAIPGIIFYFIHPALHLTANSIMTMVGFIMIILVTPAFMVLLTDFSTALKEIRRRKVGVHEVERSRLVTSYVAFSYGVEYMKKRRLRTILTLITLIVVVISVIVFTSMTSYVAPKPVMLHGYTPTRPQGFLLQRESVDRNLPLGEQLYDLTKTLIDKHAVKRYWAVGALDVFVYNDPSRYYSINCITAMQPSEDQITNISKLIIKGRWFNSNDTYAAIIPYTTISDTKGAIDVNKTIVIAGIKFRVIGAYDDRRVYSIIELDGQTFTPVIGFPRARAVRTIIIPARIAEENPWMGKGLGFFLAQISIRTRQNPYVIGRDVVFILPSTDTYVYSPSIGVAKYSRMIALSGSGFSYISAPIIIASVSILGVLLGSIYERRREIFIYAALGLSPSQIGLMFVAEALAYALMATVIGYVIGILLTTISASLLPGVFKPNYSSGYVALAIGATFLSVLSATIYPIIKASKMALPSLRRKWELPTRPKGDEWIIPLPFKITSMRELMGSLYYVYEYISGFTSPDIGSFVVEKIGFSKTTTSDGRSLYVLEGFARLKPWHAGIRQEFQIRALESKPGEWELSIYLKRVAGNPRLWVKSNRVFIDALRKQLLLWRTLHMEDKKRYIKEAESRIRF